MESSTKSQNILIHTYYYPVHTLGPGARIGIWTQGCKIHCKGCMSKKTWSFDKDKAVDVTELVNKILLLSNNVPCGITISGGEPFNNSAGLESLLEKLSVAGFEDIIVYTGYSKDHIVRKYGWIKKYCAMLISGKYRLGLETNAVWCGSSNQKYTIFKSKFSDKYSEWLRQEKGQLQILELNDSIVIMGIPHQGDMDYLLNMLIGAKDA